VELWAIMKDTWDTPGVSEFLSALLGGGMAIGAQLLVLHHDRKKEDARRRDEQKGTAWAIYFKISLMFEQFGWALQHLEEAQDRAAANDVELWQVYQPPAHDLQTVKLETSELVLLIDHKHLNIMERYRLATVWMANLVQTLQKFSQMRFDFLNSQPADVKGQWGTMSADQKTIGEMLPKIAFLQSLCGSIEDVVQDQAPRLRKLLVDYVEVMKPMAGHKPKVEFVDNKKRGKAEAC